jgi:hypothetical protein
VKKRWIVVGSDRQVRFYEQSVPVREIHLLDCWTPGNSPNSPHQSTSFLHEAGGLGYCYDVPAPFHDPDRRAHGAFMERIAQHLDVAVKTDHVQDLCIVAPPRFLKELLQHLAPDTCSRIHAQIAKKLVDVPPDQLPSLLKDVL